MSNEYQSAIPGSDPRTRRVRRSLLLRAALSAAVVAFAAGLGTPALAAGTAVAVSLTFDNNTVSQFTLGYQQALQPHNVPATFFVNSGNVGGSKNFMSWAQLTTLAAAGNEIGGKTVDGKVNLKTTTDYQTKVDEVCNDRRALVAHGFAPASFAYPFGASDATAEGIVKTCGYGNARGAGGLSPTGALYAETLPPKNWFGTRPYGPAGQITLANLQALVNGAATHGGGWDQVIIQKVCSNSLDATNYSTCTTSAGWIELADLNAFLDWMGNAGQAGGAPAGAVFKTVGAAAASADTSLPSTTILCDNAPCAGTTYTAAVQVSLPATDTGSGVSSTHYTTDGSDPTLASPAYTGPFSLLTSVTVKYRSWDNAGNVEPVASQPIDVQLPPDSTAPATIMSCNGSPCADTPYTAAVTVTLPATDNAGGWGVDRTYYTTDGSTPTTASTVYTGPFTLKQNATVSLFSTDLAGNAEQPHSQAVQFATIVSLTFDDGIENQFSVAFQQALRPRGVHGTFYIVSGFVSVQESAVTWPQLTTMANDGQDIEGHTLNHTNLKTTTDYQTKVNEVCTDRQNLIDHGFDPIAMAYPYGAYDATAEQIVRDCGYSSGRAAGGVDVAGDGAGPVYSETIPPKDAYATRTVYDPVGDGIAVNLDHLKASVTAAAQNGGGWVPLVFHQICSQTYDPANYAGCVNDYGPIQLDTLTAFLDWLGNAGQAGGAPAGTTVKTVREVIAGPDLQAPTTTVTCDGAPCQDTTYNGSATVALTATDKGGAGVKATYYTTDDSAPTMSSPVFSRPFTVTGPTTIRYFSVDNSGNIESAGVRQIQVAANPDPVIGAAGDIACDPGAPAFNAGEGTDSDCRARHTAPLLNGVDAVLPIGDNQYECGSPSAYQQSYDTSWGPKLAITHPVPGDKDYATTGGTGCPTTPGAGYYDYFGARAGEPGKGYYSYNLGQWHIIALNTAPCPDTPAFCAAGSEQEQWLRADLAATAATSCTLAYYQNPRWVSTASGSGGNADYQTFWRDLYDAGADVVLNGDSHWYERFTPLNGAGGTDANYGVREFVVGTGGAGLDTPGAPVATSEALNASTHGVLRMTLHAGSYSWTFAHDTDGTFTDSGSTDCHAAPDLAGPTTTAACNGAACAAGWYGAPVEMTLTGTDTGGSGLDKTYYTVDGSTPTTSSTVYTGPFTVPATATVRYFSTDKAGNTEAVKSQLVQIDTAAPITGIACGGAPCAPGWYTAAVQVTLTGTDTGGGSGVDKTYYTVDGSTPTTSSTVYTGPFMVAATALVGYFTVDAAGNAEPVRTQQIQIDSAGPTTSVSCDGSACAAGFYRLGVQVALTATDNSGGSGVDKTYYTTDGSTPTTASTVYTGPFTVSATTTVKFFSTDAAGGVEAVNTQLIQIDNTGPTTATSCNGSACSAGWYNGPVQVTLTATDNAGGSGVDKIYYTTDGSSPTTLSTVYTGPVTVSATGTVRYFAMDVAGNFEATSGSVPVQIDTVPATTTVTCNGVACPTGWYRTTPVTIQLAATDTGGSGVDKTYYTTNGSTPTTASTAYTGPFTVSATTTVKFFSTDKAGNAEAVKSQLVQIDTTRPTTTASCNATACSTGWYTAAVQVSLTGTDNTGGSGVDKTYYTVDGSTPTTASTVYAGPFTVPATATVRYFSVDKAGNVEATVRSQLVQIDPTKPTTTATCGGTACSTGWYAGSVQVTLTAIDNSGGSGVSKTYYTTNGSTPTTSSQAYNNPFTVSATTTVKFFSTDKAGNAEAAKSQLVQIDTTRPTTTASCNATACSTGWYTAAVQVSLTGTDNTGGAGLDKTYYTVDGSAPTTSSTVYTGPFTVSATTTVRFLSTDKVGNAEVAKSQLVRIDGAAPWVWITQPSNGASLTQFTTVTIAASAFDVGTGSASPSGVTKVDFYVDSTRLTTDTSSPYQTNWFVNVTKGTHTLSAVATDAAGNAATYTITVTVR